jgi:hypothetical protein
MSEVSKYQSGKIYKIVCNKTNLVYIGSTTQKYLSNRLKGHRSNYNQFLKGKGHFISSYKLLENNDYYIELIELFPCNSKDELLVRERHYFDIIECVNKFKPISTDDEDKEYHKQYREDNKDKAKEYRIQYIEDNKEILKDKRKQKYENNKEDIKERIYQYRRDNIEAINERRRKHYQDNKEKINEKRKVKFVCDCGSECGISEKPRHEKSQKHLNYINNK